jgi:amino acid transporter
LDSRGEVSAAASGIASPARRPLNRVDPNAGASYAWVEKAFGPVLGFLAGWSLLVATALFMVSGTVPAATATLDLIAPSLTANPTSVTLVAAGWLLAVSALVVKGIKPASYTQVVLTTIEVAILILVIITALVKFGSSSAHSFSIHWLSLGQFTPQLFATGALTAVFFFWGWDVTLNLNEETKNAHHTPNRMTLSRNLLIPSLLGALHVYIGMRILPSMPGGACSAEWHLFDRTFIWVDVTEPGSTIIVVKAVCGSDGGLDISWRGSSRRCWS